MLYMYCAGYCAGIVQCTVQVLCSVLCRVLGHINSMLIRFNYFLSIIVSHILVRIQFDLKISSSNRNYGKYVSCHHMNVYYDTVYRDLFGPVLIYAPFDLVVSGRV